MPAKKPLSYEAVIEKALQMAQADGIDSIGYNALARKLGIRPQSMYRYVSNLKELRCALIRRELDGLAARVTAAAQGLEPAAALRAYAVALYDACHENRLFYEALTLMHSYGLIDEMKEPLSQIVNVVQEQFARLDPDPARAARHVQLFMAVNLGYAQMSMTPFFPKSLHDDRDAFVRSIDEVTDELAGAPA